MYIIIIIITIIDHGNKQTRKKYSNNMIHIKYLILDSLSHSIISNNNNDDDDNY